MGFYAREALEDLADPREARRERIYAGVPGVSMSPRSIATLLFFRPTGNDADGSGGADGFAAPCCPEVQPLQTGDLSCFFTPAGPAEVTAEYVSDAEDEVPR
eukprot:8135890-Pyramimonas_sp.AAC.1